MLPNKRTVAMLLLGVLMMQVMPMASAQTDQSDLQVTQIFTRDPAIVGKVTTVVVVVENTGNARSAGSGYEVFVTHNGACLDREDKLEETPPTAGEQDPARGCIRPGGALDRGGRAELTFRWVPRAGQAGPLTIHTSIRSPTSSTSGIGGVTNPDTQTGNNERDHTNAIKVISPRVEIVPDRDAPPGRELKDAWREGDITTDCPTGQVVIRTGCRAVPEQILNYNFFVYNRGNEQDVIKPSFTGIQEFVDRGYEFRFTSPSVTVAPNGTGNLGVIVVVPKHATTANEFKLNVNAISARVLVTSGWKSDVTSSVTEGAMPSVLIKRVHGLNLTSNETIRISNVTQPTTFNITLNNTGNEIDRYLVRFHEGTGTINSSWGIPAPTVYEVGPGALNQSTIRLQLTPPRNATVGWHSINISVESVIDTTGITLRTMTLTADLKQNFSIRGQVLTGLVSRVPAQEASFTLRLTNDGNGVDNVTLRLAPLVQGFTGGLSQSVVTIPAFSSRDVYLNVTPPPNSPKDREYGFYVNATASGPLNTSPELRPKTDVLEARVRILPGSNLRVETGPTSSFVDPSGKTNYTMRIVNTGNEKDRFNIETRSASAAWAASASLAQIDLDPLAAADITVSVTAPGIASVGETNAVEVVVTGTTDTTRSKTTKFESRISGPDLFVDRINLNTSAPYAGDDLQVTVVVGNAGNIAPTRNATLRVYLVQGGSETEIGTRDITPDRLRGGARLTETFLWSETLNHAGEGVLVAKIDPDDLISEIDESESSNERSSAITLRTFDLRVPPLAQGLSGRPGERVTYGEAPYTFVIEHRGNQPIEPVRIVVESENGWGKRDFTFELQRGLVLNVTVDLLIPERPGVATDKLTMTVTPTLRPDSRYQVSTTTTVIDDVKPRINSVAITPARVVFGEKVEIQTEVVDATGLSSVKAVIVAPDNRTDTIPLQRADGDMFVGTASFSFAGTYRAYIEAIDRSLTPNTNTSRDVVVSFKVEPGSVPVIKLAPGQGSTIRTGAMVKLNITDPLGIGRASYEIKGITYELNVPYQIDTARFPNGTLEVLVTAENIYGAATTETIKLTVDNTPPGINKVGLTPEKPKVNEDVTLRIETDAKVAAVDVVVKRNGQVLETRSATKERDGVFTLILNPGEGDYTLDVSAKDAAGNTKLESGAVIFSAKPASLLPAPGLAWLAAIAVGVALALRRRH